MSPHADHGDLSGSTLCIGVFDGVHRGHQALLNRGREMADQLGNKLVVVTFDPHPLSVVKPELAPKMITSIPQRIKLLRDAGADNVHVLNFTPEMSTLSSEQFTTQELVDRLNAVAVVVGENFTFGYRAKGNAQILSELGKDHGFIVSVVPLKKDSEPISSSRIRRLIESGEVSNAARLLGHPYLLAGIVVEGDARGRGLGFPTANLEWAHSLIIPGDGVYAGHVIVGENRHPAAISVGSNPQFGGVNRRIEAFILEGKDWNLYGQDLEFEFNELMRPQMVFPSIEGYLGQMTLDVDRAHQILSGGLLP
jgi:riboflavin kinase / FMN adenylyltransferase